MIDFVEERLELGYGYGVVGGPQFKTNIVKNGAGEEQRNGEWWFPLGRWQLGERMLLDSDLEGIKEVEYLRNFHSARIGSKQGFRFKDWADYKVVSQVLGISDGVTSQWQLKKSYWAGENEFFRAITKPVPGTAIIYLDGLEVTFPQVDYETGVLSFPVPLSAGTVISCDFLFDVPVTFERDDIEWSLEAIKLETGETLHRLGSVFVKEIRIPLVLEWYHRDPMPSYIDIPLDLGMILETSQNLSFSNRTEGLSSGYESKSSAGTGLKNTIKLPGVKFTQAELDKLLGYFWVARGRLVYFLLRLNNQLKIVRFNSDSLSIKFEAIDRYEIMGEDEEVITEENKLFTVENLDFLASEINIPQDTYVMMLIDNSTAIAGEQVEFIKDVYGIIADIAKDKYGEEYVTKYFPGAVPYVNRDWLRWFDLSPTSDPTTGTNEPRKFLFLVLVASAEERYHDDNSYSEPTPMYLDHLNSFINNYGNFDSFKAIIYGENVNQFYANFAVHLSNAMTGSNGYPVALSEYNMDFRLNCSPLASPAFYLS